MLDLRLVRYFVAVAETEHVGRAARQLHISQSPLSRQIRQLEDQLRMQLFERAGRRVHLTDHGRWLLAQSRELLDRAERFERDAARVAAGEVGSLSIGFVKSALWNRLLPAALREFARSRPEVQVALQNLPSHEQVMALRRGELDLGLVHSAAATPEMTVSRLVDEPFLLAIPGDHRLATRARIGPKQLDGTPWVVVARGGYPAAYDRLIAACGRAGFVPDVRVDASDWATALAFVAAGAGLALVPASARPIDGSGIAFRKVPWFPLTMRLQLIQPATGASAIATRFAEVLVACATASGRGGARRRLTHRRRLVSYGSKDC